MTTHSAVLTVPRVLSIAGTDPTGGAGQAADLKSIAAMGGYGMNVITAVVAQNTTGVIEIHTPPVRVLRAQLEAASSDVTLDAVKVGMLGSVEVIEAVRDWLAEVKPPVTVIDPVMVATAGGRLLRAEAHTALLSLLPFADLITPNLPELAVLAGADPATTWAEALRQGREVADRFGARVLVKGGHMPGPRTPDALLEPGRHEPVITFDDPRVATSNTHGTGCSLSSAIATIVARTGDWPAAVSAARSWLRGALEHADDLHVGHGNGPVHHFHHAQHVLADSASHERVTDVLWRDCERVRREIDTLEFIAQLADGTLPPETFQWYLDQDMQYLTVYSRALAALAAAAPSESAREFFAHGAAEVVTVESALHRTRLNGAPPHPASEVTRTYTDFLLAATGSETFAVGAAAVLPCYWLYATLGSALLEKARAAGPEPHPYGDWLATYNAPAFHLATERAREIVDRAAATADPATVRRMRDAFMRACELELRFFAEPVRRAGARPFAVASTHRVG
ncbi:bifunctional hydroxymethylpyrimidine kinase/phosphomethylpyrimidine kinase [Kocuria sp. cx-116]|uniref:bifunctional hydroxymethylpyrimidine kinase/phosphomethylpyrimidine kinase n=1 Tax=Kocuria sp. cx-116 TaxID=2771378 RepID=UPI00168550F2|nr:bifunctional hydroxymethylpyrimidine kinase/phosphomethylpyrimidine kinase [Kocuria sp. cx-116]MBD2761255.1 bifunctional hydroxymethylpyrimidine kinase/phosphomethylpyrimidine kinase [Kocuria sp. cx-116]